MSDNVDLNHVECPYCKAVLTSVWEVMSDQDDSEIECSECNKIFIISRSVSYSIKEVDQGTDRKIGKI